MFRHIHSTVITTGTIWPVLNINILRLGSYQGWNTLTRLVLHTEVIKMMGMEGRLTSTQASKKWDNLNGNIRWDFVFIMSSVHFHKHLWLFFLYNASHSGFGVPKSSKTLWWGQTGGGHGSYLAMVFSDAWVHREAGRWPSIEPPVLKDSCGGGSHESVADVAHHLLELELLLVARHVRRKRSLHSLALMRLPGFNGVFKGGAREGGHCSSFQAGQDNAKRFLDLFEELVKKQ